MRLGGRLSGLEPVSAVQVLAIILTPQADLSLGARSHFTWILVLAVI